MTTPCDPCARGVLPPERPYPVPDAGVAAAPLGRMVRIYMPDPNSTGLLPLIEDTPDRVEAWLRRCLEDMHRFGKSTVDTSKEAT